MTRRWRRSSFGRTRRLLEGSSIAADTAWKTLRVLSSRRSSKLGWETRDKLVLSSVRKALLTCMVDGSMSVQHKILETTELGGVVDSSRCSQLSLVAEPTQEEGGDAEGKSESSRTVDGRAGRKYSPLLAEVEVTGEAPRVASSKG